MDASATRPRHPAPLRVSLWLGAAYDAVFAVLMVAAPRPTARLLRLPLPPLPEGAFYLWIMAVLLLMLASLYVIAARDLGRHGAIVAVAASGRILGGLALLAAAAGQPGLAGLYPLAAADLAFGLAHAAFWGTRARAASRGPRPRVASRGPRPRAAGRGSRRP
jgi:uncharacterized membrane protein YvlD (DUF360 family)